MDSYRFVDDRYTWKMSQHTLPKRFQNATKTQNSDFRELLKTSHDHNFTILAVKRFFELFKKFLGIQPLFLSYPLF